MGEICIDNVHDALFVASLIFIAEVLTDLEIEGSLGCLPATSSIAKRAFSSEIVIIKHIIYCYRNYDSEKERRKR